MKKDWTQREFWMTVAGVASIALMVALGVPITPDVVAGAIGLMVGGYGVSRGIAKRGSGGVSPDLEDKIDKAFRRARKSK